ncbi:hypothetical protein GFH48_31515 [Streptomyces fagopyri]|uniref:Uncharacterized protein n=1 Tax=Streptomyces fagopyri TaxID=2662397 RepID=A0A5Q0LKY9_9ACTN|nr:hypothetical protein [Streptomyces fagopyri]QFZ77206.1 hypothetical protein GFH48_31515 [Streptomyces fagopyri]
MSSDTLTKTTEAVPDDTAPPDIVPRRRLGRYTVVASVLSSLSSGRFHVGRHHARGSERSR